MNDFGSIRDAVSRVAPRYAIAKVAVFSLYASDQARTGGDACLLLDVGCTFSRADAAQFRRFIAEDLGCTVDVVFRSALTAEDFARAETEARVVYENPDIKTFTVGFECYKQAAANNAEGAGGKTMRDEISWARERADDLHIANTDKYIGEEEYWASLPRVQWHMDEPSADPSAVALYFVDQIAATQVKAVLSGEGADEFFGGYRIYQTPFSNAKVSWAPKGLLKGASHAMRALHLRGANYLERASETPEDWYYTNANGVAFTPEERASLLKGGCSAPTPQSLTAPVYAEVADLDETTRMQYVDLYFWLVGDILLKTDKMSMAHSLESRVPFLDRRVFDLSATIPTPLKANEQQTKLTLRDAAEFAIPKDWAQKEKLGFPVPVVNWLREERYYTMVKEWFTGDIAREFFNTDELVRLLDEHKAGADRSRKIWIVYMFLMWYKIYFVDRTVPKKPEAR